MVSLGSSWKERAEMTVLPKYRGHISAPNTRLSIVLTVRTKRLCLRDVRSGKRGGERKGDKKKKQAKSKPESQEYSQKQATEKGHFG